MDSESERTQTRQTSAVRDDDPRQLGFSLRVGRKRRSRLLNRDGSFNVSRAGLPLSASLNRFHQLMTMSWARLYFYILLIYLATNLVFAGLYILCGDDALHGVETSSPSARFLSSFFFSVQTLATIGYGVIHPKGLAANFLVCVEALLGLMGFAFATATIFARFSRPVAHVLFSDNAIVAPYNDGKALMFRVVNSQNSELIEIAVQVMYTATVTRDGKLTQLSRKLDLELSKIAFFPLHWTVVHPITPDSPLWGVSKEDLSEQGAEFIVLLTGIEETFSQSVHQRSSYGAEDMLFDARFSNMFTDDDTGLIQTDLRKLNDTEPITPSGKAVTTLSD